MPAGKRLITAEDVHNIAYVEDPQISPDGEWIAYVHMTVDKLEDSYLRRIWLAPTSGGDPLQLTRGKSDTNPRWSPDGKTIAFTSMRGDKPQVYLLPIAAPGGEARALTSMTNGANSPSWSPDGTQIAYLSSMNADERQKEDSGEEPTPPADKFEAEQRAAKKKHDEAERWKPRRSWRIPYRVGTSFVDDRFSQVYLISVDENLEGDDAKPRRLTDTDTHYDQPQWTPDGKHILTAHGDDPQADEHWMIQHLYQLELASGKETPLTSDDFTYFSPHSSPDGKWIACIRNPRQNLFSSNARLCIIPTGGGDPRDLSVEMDRPVGDFKWTSDSASLIFNAADTGRTEIYQASIEGDIEKIIPGLMDTGQLTVSSEGGVAFTAVTPHRPPELFWQPPGADEPMQLTEVNQWVDEVIVQDVHEMWFDAPDGQKIQGWYILPVGYEEGKTYPLAFNIHGGPHVMWSASAKTMFHEWQHHAAEGYAVFFCNPRGGAGYGEEFQDAIHGAWGAADFPDLMAGIDALLEKGFVDSERMAVTGGSYGGFMTAWVTSHTDRFVSAVSQRGVYSMISQYGTTDIPALGTHEFSAEPWENHDLLWQHSPLAHAHKIKTPLLLIHSHNDFRVPISEAEQLFAFVRRSGGTVELLRYPDEGHELSRSGKPSLRISRLTEMMNWFDRYCKPE